MQRTKGWLVVKKAGAGAMGILAGAINLLFGGGGGILAVPGLQKMLDVEERQSHASAVAVMFPLSLLSLILLTMKGVHNVRIAVPIGIGALVGGCIGGVLLRKIPKTLLSLLFYGLMIYAGIRYLT